MMSFLEGYKLVFIDAEYTGEHAYTTLVSLGLVTEDEEELYFTLNDYSQDQVTDWLSKNVLNQINSEKSITSNEAYKELSNWFDLIRNDNKISLVSHGLGSDLLLLYELFKYKNSDMKFFHALHCLPKYLNHCNHFDLSTLMFLAGIDPSIDRDKFIFNKSTNKRHNAIHDAKLAKKCFEKIIDCPSMKRFNKIQNAL